MLDKNAVQTIIFKALNNINDERGPNEQIEVSLNTPLFGADAVLDSLALVSVIVDVEAAVSEASGRDISLTDDRAMGQATSPFSHAEALSNYIAMLLLEPA